jgi:methyl-accepting chemotaxis protein
VRLSLRSLMLGAVALLALMVLVQGLSSLLALNQIVAHQRTSSTVWMRSMEKLSSLGYDMLQYRLRVGRLVTLADAAKFQEAEAQAKEANAAFVAGFPAYEAMIVEADEREIWEAFKTNWDAYSAVEKVAIDLARAGQLEKAQYRLNVSALSLAQRAQKSLAQAAELNASKIAAGTAKAQTEAAIGMAVNGAALGLGALAAAWALWLVTARVLRPLLGITGAMQRLAEGDLDLQVPHAERTDEIGRMARAVQVFKDNAARMKALETEEKRIAAEHMLRAQSMVEMVGEVGEVVRRAAEGDFSARLQVASDDPEMGKLVAGINEINRVVDEATAEFARVLGNLARGDLTETVGSPYLGRFGELKEALNETVARLSQAVSTIQSAAQDVSTAAHEIRAGANDLSGRTEQQASSLEETAATTEQLATSVKASAASSREAVDLADEAMGVARAGGAIVSQAVDAMARIERASQRISDITGVIDEIAFQTNLLALNAAVEAARAGEAGKGFAVVASEVRTLAQRSSDAAKEITSLISASVAEVGQGVGLVRSAGDALGKIVTASQKVTDTVSQISAVSSEQANGIDQMSHAIAHMDEMTQQNAGLAQETALSAGSLTDHIARLTDLVARFKVPGSQPTGVGAPLRAARRAGM